MKWNAPNIFLLVFLSTNSSCLFHNDFTDIVIAPSLVGNVVSLIWNCASQENEIIITLSINEKSSKIISTVRLLATFYFLEAILGLLLTNSG